MEAAMVSASHGAMGSLLGKLGDLLVGNYKLLKEAKGEVMFLKAELESMHVFLKKMADTEEPDEQAKCWAKEVRELSYDIEDSVDEFRLRVECDSNNKPHGFKGFMDRSMKLLTTINTRHKVAKEFQGFKSRVMEVNERRKRYMVDGVFSKPNNTTIDPRLLAIYVETAGLVGINRPRDELIQLVTGKEDFSACHLKVLSVFGFGGLGKTTLANEIYRELEEQFQCRAFVSVSQKPNMRKIMKIILSQIGFVAPQHTNMEIWDEYELITALKKFLLDKRYCVVIDDVWDATTWNIIRRSLPDNRNGSRVIITTRIENVARACCSNHHDHVYKMKSLSNGDSRRLFFKRVFGSEGACPLYLEEAAAKILKRCGGLPLAITIISGLLASQQNKLEQEWENVVNSLGSNFEVNPTMDGLRQILGLSYINLPHYLKTCMLYLGAYPEDYTIGKNDLIRQWVAQGFISNAHGGDLEDVAKGYFNELVNRSIIQPADKDYNDEVLSCKVHDMMLDLIIHKCREENFINVVDDSQDMVGLHGKVRRLSLNLDGTVDGAILGTIQLTQVRALVRFGTSYTPSLLEFKHLRVLSIEFSSKNHTSVLLDLTGICHLFQLSFLKIVAHQNIALPSKIRRLQQLETLEIKSFTNIVEVPSDVFQLRRLLHLIVPCNISLPCGIGIIESLRTLQDFNLGLNSMDNIRDLGNLTNLRDLQICFDHDKQFDDTAAGQHRVALCSSLEKLGNLKYLRVSDAFPDSFGWDELISISSYPRLVQRLHMLCWFSGIPKWIGQLHHLYDLQLRVKEVWKDDFEILAQLHTLIHLDLYIGGIHGEEIIFHQRGFPVLKHFRITSNRKAHLTFEAGAMPKLERLEIVFDARGWDSCRSFDAVPAGIKHLPSLKEISARTDNISTGADDVGLIDDFSWRKYGQKEILGAKHPRGYYRCTHRSTHGCRATKQVQRKDNDPMLFDVVYHGAHTCVQPCAQSHYNDEMSSLEEISQNDIISTGTDGACLDDDFSWRKYGQKEILGAKHPRGYYRCTHRWDQGCLATKQVQRKDNDQMLFNVVYHGAHTCVQPSSCSQAHSNDERS